MPALRTYRLFISHAWDYHDEYYRLVEMLNQADRFEWEDLSVPQHDPIRSGELEYELRNHMRDADAFLVLSGMYVAHSDWIDFELQFARRIGLPVIGIMPRGNERVPAAVQKGADVVLGWHTPAIVDAIRSHAKRSA